MCIRDRYGQPMEVDDGVAAVIKTNIPINTAYEMEEPHLRYIKYEVENGFEVYFYKIIRGSHTSVSYTHLDVYKRQELLGK